MNNFKLHHSPIILIALISFIATNGIIFIFQTIKEDASKFDGIKDVDEDPKTSTLFNMIIESFI